MLKPALPMRSLAAAALSMVCCASQADITVVTTLAEFNALTSAPGTDNFTGLVLNSLIPTPMARTTNVGATYSYTVSSTGSGFFGVNTVANPWLTTNISTDEVLFDGLASTVLGLGGNFFGSDVSAQLVTTAELKFAITDSSGVIVYTMTGATTSSFIGFVSSTGLLSVQYAVSLPAPGAVEAFPTVDNLVLAVNAVPEPETYALMLAGLGAVGFLVRRRQH